MLVFMFGCGDKSSDTKPANDEDQTEIQDGETDDIDISDDDSDDIDISGGDSDDADTSDTGKTDDDTDTGTPVNPDDDADTGTSEKPDNDNDTDTGTPETNGNYKISGTVQAGSATTVTMYECGKSDAIASANTNASGKFTFNTDITAAKTYCVKAGDFASCFKGASDHVANISEITNAAYLLNKTCADIRKSETKIRTYAKLGTGEWLGELDYSKLSGISEGLKLLSSFIGSNDAKTLSAKIAEDAKKDASEFGKFFNGFKVVSDKTEIVIGESADSNANFSVEGGSSKVAPGFRITWTLKNKSAEAATYKFTTSTPGEYTARAKLDSDGGDPIMLSQGSATVLFLQRKNGGTVYISDTSKNISFRIDDGIYGIIPKGTVVKKNGNQIKSISYDVLTAGGSQVSRLKFRPEGAVFEGDTMYFVHELGTVFGGDPIMLSSTRTNADGSVDVMNSAAGDPIMMAAAGDPIMTTAAGDPIMQAAAGDPIMTSAAGDPIMTAAAGDPIMTSAAGDPIMTSAAGDPIMNAAAGDPIMTSAAGDPIMLAAAGDPIMMGTSSSAMISQTSHYSTFTVEAANLPVSVEALVARWCDGSYYHGFSPVEFIKEGVDKYKPAGDDKTNLMTYLDCATFGDLGNDLYELINKPVGFQRNLNLIENLFFTTEFHNRMLAKQNQESAGYSRFVAVKNGLELRSAIAALYTATTSYNRSSNIADLFDPSMIPLTYSGVAPKDYTTKAKAAILGDSDAAERYAATKKEMMIFANYITTSSKGPDFSSVEALLTPDQLICAWMNPETPAQNCNKIYTLNEAGHVALGGTEVTVAEANAVFTKYFMPMNSRLSNDEKLDLFRTFYLALKYAGTIFYNGSDIEELRENLLETAYLVFDGINANANAVTITDTFDASAHTVSVLDGAEMATVPYLTKLSALTDQIALKVAAASADVEKLLISIEGYEFDKVQENTRTYYKPKSTSNLKEKSVILTPGTIAQGEKALKTLLGSENVDELGSIIGKMTIVANSKISGKTYTTQKTYNFFVNDDGDGVNSKPVPANIQIFVNDSNGQAIASNANPTVILNPGNKVFYAENGLVSITDLAPAAYTIDAFADGYYAKNVSVNVPSGATFGVEIRLDEELTSTADANLELNININTVKHPSKVYIQIYNDDMDLVANEAAKFIDAENTYETLSIALNSGRYTLLAVGEDMYRYLEAITLYAGNNEKTITVVAKNACGNGIVDSAEECEPSVEGSTLEVLCGEIYPASTYPEKTAACDPMSCTFNKTECGKAALCGDGIIDKPSEACDGGSKACAEIEGFGNSTGSAPCASDCSGYITANNCSKTTAECGTLPANALWNDGVGRFAQTYNGENWLPAAKSANFGTTKEECVFSCAKGYKWNGSICEQYPLSLALICTGATDCFDNTEETECPAYGVAFFGQDAQYATAGFCTPHTFTTSGSGNKKTVTDSFTHYEWQAASSSAMTWDQAEAACANYEQENGGSTAVWRLPSPAELLTIIDSGTASPALGDIFTANGHTFWATEDAKQNGNAWRVDENGALTSVAKATTNSVICVRIRDYDTEENRFTAASETVKDSVSGLMWQKQAVASRTWAEALNYCEEVSTADKFDWRLPNRNELASLIDYTRANGAASNFPAIAAKGFWTSTSSLSGNEAWTVDFESGSITSADKTDTKYIICVRNDEPCLGGECADPCSFNACRNDGNSTGLCSANDYSFTCGCKSGFNWNHGKCLLATTRYIACVGLPENAVWNTVFGISQSYDGNKWYPSETGTFNKIASTTECRFICATNYKWDADEEKCLPVSRMAQCSDKTPYSDWNSVSRISQTWDGEKWVPSSESVYNQVPSEEECRFICKEHYTWDSENKICDGETRENEPCIGLPANAHWWNDPATVKQKWTNGAWAPSATASYNDAQVENQCFFGCNENYEWKDTSCVAKKQNINCDGLPDNAEWTGGFSSIDQTWNGSEWVPSNIGSYNTESNSAYCRYKCLANYNWNGSTCVAATQIAGCTGLPVNAQWNTVSSITQTYMEISENTYDWSPSNVGSYGNPTTTECHFTCKENYEWINNECIGRKQIVECTGLPANAQWKEGHSTVEQQWSGTQGWLPSAVGQHNVATGCSFECETEHYTWDSATSTCIGKTRNNQDCTGKPDSAVWNTVSKINQTWNGKAWLPDLNATYNENSAIDECRFKCPVNYTWNGATCEPRTQIVSCGTLPANAAWNTVSQIKQTWNGSTEKWEPAVNLEHNDTSSETECRYTCKTNYEWKNNQCTAKKQTAACQGLPANAVWNKATVEQTWNGTSWSPETNGTHTTGSATDRCYFKCIDENILFDWVENKCIGHTNTNPVACSQPADPNAELYATIIIQKYTLIDESTGVYDWRPVNTPSYSATEAANQCLYHCKQDYEWNGSACVGATKTAQCGDLPLHASWNIVSSITQTYNGSTYAPEATLSYCDTPSSERCCFKCDENYEASDDGKSCVAGHRTRACEGLPANALWITSSSETGNSLSITQEWSGSEWTPSLTGTHGSYLEGYCRFTCSYEGDRFKWEGGACVPNTKTDQACEGLPENAEWTGGFTKISQTWNTTLNNFEPSNVGTYSTEADSAYCRFQCKEHYIWSAEEGDDGDDGDCVAETRVMDCDESGLPENALWNYAPYITQTWDGSDWAPSLTPEYSITGSENKCRYICDTGYYHVDGQCVTDPCDSNPCQSITFSSNTCTAQPDSFPLSYSCKCFSDAYWHGKTGCRSDKPTNFCTGASRCYGDTSEIDCPSEGEAFYGQDAQYAEMGFCAVKTFTVEGTETQPVIYDKNTGLGWQKSTRGSSSTWKEADEYCNNLSYGGYNDWRLPSIKELDTVLDLGKTRYGLDPNYFSNATHTSWVSNKNTTVNKLWRLSNSTIDYIPATSDDDQSYKYDVRCVRGTALTETTSFDSIEGVSGVIKDNNTGLYWQTSVSARSIWQDALKRCEDSTVGGYTDWRLPNINELSSLLNYSKTSGGFSYHPTLSYYGGQLWSSTTLSASGTSAFIVNFTTGGRSSGIKNNRSYLEYSTCVRSDRCGEGKFLYGKNCVRDLCATTKPCESVDHSDGSCTPVTQTAYICGCEEGYMWNPSTYKCEENTCLTHNICADMEGSNGICTPATTGILVKCGCVDGYFWDGSRCRPKGAYGNICTGQAACYDNTGATTCPSEPSGSGDDYNFYGQDAQYRPSCTAKSFNTITISGNDVVEDLNTGLMWQKTVESATFTFNQAVNYCANLEYGGYTDWRLPKPKELLTTIDSSKYVPATSTTYFPGNSSAYYWTSKKCISSGSFFWVIDIVDGKFTYNAADLKSYVRCVRGKPLPDTSSFETTEPVSGQKVVTDSVTGLMWQDTQVNNINWQAALEYCEDSTYAGYDDWRLPNKDELISIFNFDAEGNSYSSYSDFTNKNYWSSTTYQSQKTKAWTVDFYNGQTNNISSKTSSGTYAYVRCVR